MLNSKEGKNTPSKFLRLDITKLFKVVWIPRTVDIFSSAAASRAAADEEKEEKSVPSLLLLF